MMEKNSVLGSPSQIKTASKGANCPLCGKAVDILGSLPRCPKHGTAPFEAASHIRKIVNEQSQ